MSFNESDDPKDGKLPSSAHRPRAIRAVLRRLTAVSSELASLRAAEDDARDVRRRTDDTRRKFLAGQAILMRAIGRLGRVRWLQRQLDAGLTRAAERRLFGLKDGEPLIPEEDWPGWPARLTDTQAAVRRSSTSPARRRARIAYLERQEQDLQNRLRQMLKADEPKREARNNHRMILVGAVILSLSLRRPRVARWLRKLLDDACTEARDRELYRLEGAGPLVREEDQVGLRPTRRQAEKKRPSDDGPAAAAAADAPDPRSTSRSAANGGHPGSSTTNNAQGNPDPEGAPIPGWRPRSIPVASTSHAEVGPRKKEWGAQLVGSARVASLPTELCGKRITVTDSGETSWTTTITEIVSRDKQSILVRHTGRPRFG